MRTEQMLIDLQAENKKLRQENEQLRQQPQESEDISYFLNLITPDIEWHEEHLHDCSPNGIIEKVRAFRKIRPIGKEEANATSQVEGTDAG